MPTRRNELARVLADIYRLLADLEEIAEDPEDDDRDLALALLIEFQEARRNVEVAMRSE